MSVVIRLSMLEYMANAHAITGNFGTHGKSASKIKYN